MTGGLLVPPGGSPYIAPPGSFNEVMTAPSGGPDIGTVIPPGGSSYVAPGGSLNEVMTAPGGGPDSLPASPVVPGGIPFFKPDGSFDWEKALAAFGPAAIGALGANKQADNLKDLADKYMAFGAPSRGRYEGSYAPGFSMSQDPGFSDMIDQGSQGILRQLSAKGNPYGNPASITQATDYVTKNVAYPALTQYRSQYAATGGLAAFNTAAPGMDAGAASAQTNWMGPLAAGLQNYLNPPKTMSLSDLLKQRVNVNI